MSDDVEVTYTACDPNDPNLPEDVRDATQNLYDQLDALDPDLRSLFTLDVMTRTTDALEHLISEVGPEGPVAAIGQIHALLSLVGYTVQHQRDEEGRTATGDTRVDEVFRSYHALVRQVARSMMTPEQIEQADKVAAEVRQRVSAGADFATAFEEARQSQRPSEEKPASTGMYL